MNVLYYICVLLGTILLTLGIVYVLKKPFNMLVEYSIKQLNTLLDNSIQEEDKDRLILSNLIHLLKWLFINIAILGLLIAIAIIPVLLYQHFTSKNIDTSSLYFFGSMILGSCVLFFFKKKGDYSYWDKMIHTIILDNYALGKYLFNREIVANKTLDTSERKFVIVTGLARGGTTALTNLLYDEKKFHSIKYSNVPFLLAPKLWQKIYKPKKEKLKERAHGDKVLFGQDSIEALEEYFFKAHLNDSYVHENTLTQHEVSDDVFEKYLKYQELFKTHEDTIYLAKNNNFILRYPSLIEKNKAFQVVMMFRDPIQHAYSLLKQHKNFITQQSDDEFVKKYMTWLGHYEFGLNQKVFDFGNLSFPSDHESKMHLAYWIDVWINYYRYVDQKLENYPNLTLVHYNDLAQYPKQLKSAIANQISIPLATEDLSPFPANRSIPAELSEVSPSKIEDAQRIYQSLMSKKLKLN